jgi:hypothetical protein
MSTSAASESSASDLPRPGALRRAWWAFVRAPAYEANAADRRTISLVGVEMPFRAAVAIAVVTFAVLLDYSRTFIPRAIQDLGFARCASSRSSGSCCSA